MHETEDAALFENLVLSETERRVAAAIDDGEIARRRELIRNVDNVSVLVSSESPPPPVQIAEWVGVPRTSLFSVADGTPAWIYEVDGGESGDGAWIRRPLDRAVVSGAFLLALSPDQASYDDIVGLRLGVSGGVTPVRTRPASERPRFGYMREPYLLHALRVLRVGLALEQTSYVVPELDETRPGMAVAIKTLDAVVGVHGLAARLCRLAASLHDVGKLSRPWQRWAASWQGRVSNGQVIEMLAHTDFDPLLHRGLSSEMKRSGHVRPPHAVASALASESIARNAVVQMSPQLGEQDQQNLTDAVLTAIGRHHAPLAKADCSFDPERGATDLLGRTLTEADLPVPDGGVSLPRINEGQLGRFSDMVVRLGEDGDRGGKEQDRIAMAVYWLVVRYLRTSDGHSQALARVDEC